MTRAAVMWFVAVTFLTSALIVPPSPSQAPMLPPKPEPSPTIQTEPNMTIRGRATWFDAQRGGQSAWYTRKNIVLYGAAGPAMREIVPHKWRNQYEIIVTSKLTGISAIVTVVDFCECLGGDENPDNDRLIDLAPAVWDALGVPLWRGVTAVTIEILPTP